MGLVVQGMRRNMRQYGMLIALGLIVALFAVWTDGDLLLPRNVSNLVLQNSHILILAIGMMLVIIAGHIDLSVGSLTAFVGSLAAVLMVKNDMPWPLAVVLCLAIGAVAGAVQGFFIAYGGIPSFIVTLAGMLIFRGLTEIFLEGQTLGPFPKGSRRSATASCRRSARTPTTTTSRCCWASCWSPPCCSRRCGTASGRSRSRWTCCRATCSC